MRCFRQPLHTVLTLSASVGALLYTTSGLAAERVVLRYGILEGSVSVADLTTLAETGKPTPELDSYLRLAKREPQQVQKVLTDEVEVDPVILSQVLNNPLGEVLLDKLGETIRTPRGGAERQALRSALVLSASNDKKISLIETLQKYPTQEVHVDGENLVSAYRQLSDIAKQVRRVFGWLDIFQ
ncbi:alpha/beta hydrolase [Leptolyngbya sp. FACHB-36]|uniref:alpha/beta hydrolase n=1 Tax=Leptolyngbya sp. FACHB-36 TaxID=2692808 RepID=UPI00168032C0|nr:alpha/beta hydrolase [Leptolyngbya sp. FACHB-36]MBD2019739.1 alpha/beta hydrolase [Leptolyngbya sp. FACHB-36]